MSAILAGVDPVFNTMIEVLVKNTTSYPWLDQVINKLRVADNQIKNEFVVSFSKHYVNTKFALLNVNPKTKEADIRILDDNSSSRIQVMKANWKNNLLASNLVIKSYEEDGGYSFNQASVNEMTTAFEEAEKVKFKNFDVDKWLRKAGIELHPKLIQDLKHFGYRPHPRANYTMEYTSLFTNNKGLFRLVYNILKNISKNPDGEVRESKLLSDSNT